MGWKRLKLRCKEVRGRSRWHKGLREIQVILFCDKWAKSKCHCCNKRLLWTHKTLQNSKGKMAFDLHNTKRTLAEETEGRDDVETGRASPHIGTFQPLVLNQTLSDISHFQFHQANRFFDIWATSYDLDRQNHVWSITALSRSIWRSWP